MYHGDKIFAEFIGDAGGSGEICESQSTEGGAGILLPPETNAGGSDVNFKSPGDGLRSGSLSNAGGSAKISQSEGNAGSYGSGIDGESRYLFCCC